MISGSAIALCICPNKGPMRGMMSAFTSTIASITARVPPPAHPLRGRVVERVGAPLSQHRIVAACRGPAPKTMLIAGIRASAGRNKVGAVQFG